MQVGKWLSFTGASLALALMTVISVGIGYACKSVPDALKSSLPIGQYLGVALMVYFGVKTLRVRARALAAPAPGHRAGDVLWRQDVWRRALALAAPAKGHSTLMLRQAIS